MKQYQIEIFSCSDDCPPQLQKEVDGFNGGLTGSFSRAAKASKFSVWHHAERAIGPAVERILGSEMWKAIAPGGFALAGKRDPRGMENRCRIIARLFARALDYKYEAGMERQFHVLEFLRSLIVYCRSIHPHTYSSMIEGADGLLYPRRLKLERHLPHSPFCELCDQLSEVMEEIRSGNKTKYAEGQLASSRFCKSHRPDNAEYRRAHNYRHAFHQKIADLSRALREGRQIEGIDEVKRLLRKDDTFRKLYSIDLLQSRENNKREAGAHHEYSLLAFVSGTDEVIRQVAYQLVHPELSKTRKKTAGRKGEILAYIELAQAQGKSIAMAARELGISRQAAWKALNL